MDQHYLLIALIGLLFFYRSIYLGYCVDDKHVSDIAKKNKASFNGTPASIKDTLYHCLYGAGLFNNIAFDHLFTTTLHIVNSCLVYAVSGSFLASILFLLSPVNNQVALWLNGRRYAVGILCVLLSWKFPLLFLPLYAFSSWLHVYTIVTPFLMLFSDYWFLFPGCLAAFAILGYKRIVSKFEERKSQYAVGQELTKFSPKKIILYVKSLGFYFQHTILPSKPRMYHEFLYYFGRTEASTKRGYSLNFDFFKGVAVLAFITYEIFFHHNLWAIWWLVFISQYCNLVTVTMSVADRYCSLAGIGLMVIVSQYINLLPDPLRSFAAGALICYYAVKYQPLFNAYLSVGSFFMYHINIQPDGVKQRAHLASRYLEARDPFGAHYIIKQGLKYRPNDFELQLIMAKIMFAMGQFEKCLNILDRAQKVCPLGEEEYCKTEFNRMRQDVINITTPKPKPSGQGERLRRLRQMEKKEMPIPLAQKMMQDLAKV